jgi:hypothetical protein
LPKTVFLAKIFHGDRQLFNESAEAGEVWEENGKWYYDEDVKLRRQDTSSGFVSKKHHEANNVLEFNTVIAKIMDVEVAKNDKWLSYNPRKVATKAGQNKAITSGLATDHDFVVLQESFDSVTRVTSGIKTIAMQLMRINPESGANELASKGVRLCKEVVSSSEAVENLLMSDRSAVTTEVVKKCLREAARPYKALVEFHNELVTLHKHHDKTKSTGASSGSGGKFKSINL